jgi:hypothetical protein
MSLMIDIQISGEDATGISRITAALENRAPLHEKIARDAERFIKEFGNQKSQSEHRTSSALGARATGHLAKAYASIESQSDASEARLLLPRASRLRAAFGSYVLKPTRSKYLTIPVNRASYGRRAGELDDLTFLRVGPRKTAILARKDAQGNLETMYLLTTSVKISEDASLVPSAELAENAGISAEEFFDDLLQGGKP